MSILKSYHINTNGSPLHINSSPTRRSSYLDILTGSPPSELATDEKDDDGACEEEAEWWYPPEDIMPRLGECCRCLAPLDRQIEGGGEEEAYQTGEDQCRDPYRWT